MKWDVHGRVVGGSYLGEYEADTADEAIQMAFKKAGHVSLCHECAHNIEDPEIEDAFATPAEEAAEKKA